MASTTIDNSVRFQKEVRVKTIRKCTEEDVSEAWYDDSEYAGFKEQVKQDARDAVQHLGAERIVKYFTYGSTHEANSNLPLEDFCRILGLDRCFPVRSKARKRSRLLLWDAVSFFQENDADADIIAENCAKMSFQSIVHAYRVAACSIVLVDTIPDTKKKYISMANACTATKTQLFVQPMEERKIQPRIIISPVA